MNIEEFFKWFYTIWFLLIINLGLAVLTKLLWGAL